MSRRATYQRIARWYDLLDAPFERKRYQPIRSLLFAGLSGRVLDAGVGTGRNIPFYPQDGDMLGNVIAVEHPPAHDVLVVRTEAGHVARIPFVASIVLRVDQDGIQIEPPGGLLSPDLDPDA